MALFKKKADGVVDAAHLTADGQLAWVRAYERRGPTWSDLVLLDRPALIERLQAGKRFFIGDRIEFRASEFDLGQPIRLIDRGRRRPPIIVVGKGQADQDRLEGLPIV
jgi:hypothetical protein